MCSFNLEAQVVITRFMLSLGDVSYLGGGLVSVRTHFESFVLGICWTVWNTS